MRKIDMLARLVEQAGRDGADLNTLTAIVEEASDLAVERTLARLNICSDLPRVQPDFTQRCGR
ncbi:MAG: hypothetical protein U5J78_00365 [Parasphingorhabdus sp.]|nr:hypothetical protein [Parasphingorhabdus sp.]